MNLQFSKLGKKGERIWMYSNQWIAFEFQQAQTFAMLKNTIRDVFDSVPWHGSANKEILC